MYLLFVATTFLAAVLVFSIQPMVGKMLLPIAGGTPDVWNSAMVFFQTVLLLGYIYAHLSTKWLDATRQPRMHLAIVVGGLLFLPITIHSGADSILMERMPALWVVTALFLAAAWPLLVVTSTAPLVQRWLAATNHRYASDPYPLYAASNAGSMLALIAYPFLLEPLLGLKTQTSLWFMGYVLLTFLLAGCAFQLNKHPGSGQSSSTRWCQEATPDWGLRAKWFVWAFVPSSLLLSVTSLISTDLTPMPLLWVLPLALYLLTHIHAFARRRLISTRLLMRLAPLAVGATGVALAIDLLQPLSLILGLHLTGLFVMAMLFHGLLADNRPSPHHLTQFYVWLALGGVAGGAFNALAGPMLFDRLLEYPLVLLLALLVLPSRAWQDRIVRAGLLAALFAAMPIVLLSVFGTVNGVVDRLSGAWITSGFGMLLGAAAVVLVWRQPRWARVAAYASIAVVVGVVWRGDKDELLAARSFYGTHQVFSHQEGRYHVLTHGNTIHGVQRQHPKPGNLPLTYYTPLEEIFDLLAARAPQGNIAVVGLGSGSIAGHLRPEQKMTFYEIDPIVHRIAQDPSLFSFLEMCDTRCRVRLGDGRIRLAEDDDVIYQLIVLDAYSSGAIPFHLLTQEALDIFLRRLTPDGVLAFHISNNYVSLAPILGRLAQSRQLTGLHRRHSDTSHPLWGFESEWVVLSRAREVMAAVVEREPWDSGGSWEPLAPAQGRPWTDDFAPVWEAYRARFFDREVL